MDAGTRTTLVHSGRRVLGGKTWKARLEIQDCGYEFVDVARFTSQVLRAGSSLEAKCASLLMSRNLSGTERRVSPGALVEMEEYRFRNKNLEGCAFGMA